jgi:hypothetical protein
MNYRVLGALCCASLLLLHAAGNAAPVDFQREVRPLLSKRCVACHGPDEHARQANLRLDTFEGATARGVITPGNSATSRVIARVTHAKTPMPPTGERLTDEEVALLKRWIDEGAKYARHWSFDKPVRPTPPGALNKEAWVNNPIDRFVLAGLEKENLAPSPEADRYILARRVALDLTGIPPEPELLSLPYEKLVDALLESPRFGERWAKVWLDLARYADTQGYEKDNRRVIWPYRDWVIRAFNDNLPFDRFTILQLAGDLAPDPSVDDLIATGFHRNTMTNTEGGTDDEEFRDTAIRDRIAVTGQVFMGLSVGCAQCHTHKYDPITHKEFYQLYAFLNQTADNDQPGDQPLLKLTADTSTLIMRELPMEKRRQTRIFERGNYLTPGAEVEAATPEAFPPMPVSAPTNRLGLAQWIVSPENPLTARVTVNRFWARLFGKGIVETEEDFGTQGAAPSHPELLDWLATEFSGPGKWSVKALLKTMAMSSTYRQSSNATPEMLKRDPQNRLYARGPRFRLDAESVRDQALAVSGLLSKKMYGPPVMPWQPEGVWLVVYNGDRWDTSKGEDRYRRAVYTFMRRTSPYPSMANYDAPTGEVCTVRRIRTNTPLQALTSLNDPVSMEAAERLAARAKNAEQLFQLALVRPPSKAEVERLNALHKQVKAELKTDPASANKLLRYSENLYAEDRELTLIADSRTQPATWRYLPADPGASWSAADFDDKAWPAAAGPFGSGKRPPDDLKLPVKWDTDQLWLRAEVNLTAPLPERFRLAVRANVQVELHVNGVQGVAAPWERTGYYDYALSPGSAAAFKPGRNVVAVKLTRNHAEASSQFFDGGLFATRLLDAAKLTGPALDRAAWVVVANTVLNLDEMVTKR